MFCFAKFCRLCLKDSSVLINIFCIDKDNEKIVDKMKFLLPNLISPLDGLPPWVCLSCRTQVNRSFNLFKKWIESHEILQNYIHKFKTTNQVPNNTVLQIEIVGINYKLDKTEKSMNIDSRKIAVENINGNQDAYKPFHNVEDSDSFSKEDEKITNENKTILELNNINATIAINSKYQSDMNKKEEETNLMHKARDVPETQLNKIAPSNKHDVPINNHIQAIGTNNKVIEELLEIVKITENFQQEQEIATVTEKATVIDELMEITVDKENFESKQSFENGFNLASPITNIQINFARQNGERNSLTIQELSSKNTNDVSICTNNLLYTTEVTSTIKNNLEPEKNIDSGKHLNSSVQPNILQKAIEIARIVENNESTLSSIPNVKENTFLINSSEISKSNLEYNLPEGPTQNCTTIFPQINNEYSNNYSNTFHQSYLDSNFPYPHFNKDSENDNYSIDFDEVKKISGYLQDSYPGSPSNVYCNLDDKMYNQNCDTIMSNIFEASTVSSPISEGLNVNNVVENNSTHSFCTYSNGDINHVQSENYSWNTFNQDLLSKANFTLLENVGKNLETVASLESFLHKNVPQNNVSHNYIGCYGTQNNMTYSGNYSVDYNIYTPPLSANCSPVSNQYTLGNYSETQEEYSPTFRKDCFTFSEDSNGNEIPSKKAKITRKRSKITNNKENKFYQVFQDMEIASRHCNTPVEFSLTTEDTQITFLVDRNKSLYYCKTCNITFQNISEILDHASGIHSSSQDLTANEYLSINVAKPEKSVQLLVNHDIKKFVCKKCDKNFSEVAALYRHVAVHVSNQRYFCDECGKSFPVYRYLSLHKLIHSRIRVYACKLCPKTFRAKDTLRTHEIVHHEASQDKPFVCEVCGKGFVIEQYLKIHMKRHNKETGRICHICGKILKNEELCYKHIKEKHLVVNMKECEICHKTFHANRNLKAHMKLHGSRDFKCDQCEKEFFFKRDLVNHQLLHTGFRPHICQYCGKDFRSLGALYKHVRTHTKVKPHVCGVCQKAFSLVSSLQAHERVHSGEKPFKCEHCGKGYVQRNVFQQHMKKVHPDITVS